jgi:hypothetical protein
MEYIEFKDIKSIPSQKYPMEREYILDENHSFYIEPIFYTQLEGLKNIHPNAFQKIIDEMLRLVKENLHVVFVGDYEFPYINLEDYIYVEITDITNKLNIYVEDKSRGSDYGD